MRLALWTPRAERGWPARLAPALAGRVELRIVASAPGERPVVELDVYDVADDPAHVYVYDALAARPGLVVLADWNLHGLVFAATAGRGDPEAYRREAGRDRGATGRFVADQVLQGTGGALARLLPLNGRVLEAGAALVALDEDVRARAQRRLGGRPLARLPLDAPGAPTEGLVSALLGLCREARSCLPERRRAAELERSQEGTPTGRALASLRPRAHELGLAELPASAAARVSSLLSESRRR